MLYEDGIIVDGDNIQFIDIFRIYKIEKRIITKQIDNLTKI